MRDEQQNTKKSCLIAFWEPNMLSTAMIYKAADGWERQL